MYNYNCIDYNGYSFSGFMSLVEHIQDDHQVKINRQHVSFDCFNDFLQWKSNEEEQSQSHYVQNTAIETFGTNKHLRLHCNRSGSAKVAVDPKRKFRGSYKLEVNV